MSVHQQPEKDLPCHPKAADRHSNISANVWTCQCLNKSFKHWDYSDGYCYADVWMTYRHIHRQYGVYFVRHPPLESISTFARIPTRNIPDSTQPERDKWRSRPLGYLTRLTCRCLNGRCLRIGTFIRSQYFAIFVSVSIQRKELLDANSQKWISVSIQLALFFIPANLRKRLVY